ncbi:MAG TPA: D-aminoacylase, partial [Vicinamibacterales bacterium]|nr:D-aminoacylase [Vicinamibacterales bacterium]
MRTPTLALLCMLAVLVTGCGRSADHYDVLIRGGTIYDGSGLPGFQGSVALNGDRIAAVGALPDASADLVIDATGLAVSPGFINMLSWSTESLIADGRSMGEVLQGVTSQIMGEGTSMGPLTPEMKTRWKSLQGDIQFDYAWDSLAGYLQFLEHTGVSQNVASFIGAGTIREHVIGHENRPPTPDELDRMRALVRDEMEGGALGIGSSLIYAPDNFASTEELIELCRVAARHGGTYITHMRSEGNRLVEAVQETIRISREAGIPAEIYHLKAAGERNWPKMDHVIALVEAARAEGLAITADMYVYTAGSTGLNAALPPWALEGGYDALFARLADPAERARIRQAMIAPATDWESLYQAAGSPDRVLLVEFKSEALKPLTGRTLAQVAEARGTDPYDTILDLMLEDRTRVGAVYFLMSEENVRKQIALPWVSFGSDGASMAPEGVFLRSSTHPRAYGNFARLLGHYVRDEQIIPLEEAIRKLTSLPADNIHLADRGRLVPGSFADVVVFDPATIADRATFEVPHQLAVGVHHVFVNGGHVV